MELARLRKAAYIPGAHGLNIAPRPLHGTDAQRADSRLVGVRRTEEQFQKIKTNL